MKKYFYAPAIALLTFVLFTTCKKEDKPIGIFQLYASPDTLVMIDNQESGNIYLSAQPEGNVDFIITSHPSWLKINTLNGRIKGDIQTIEVGRSEQIDEGIYKGSIEIISDEGGPASVYVIMSVEGHPKIKTSLDRLYFPAGISEVEMIIENTGNGILSWSFGDLPQWLKASDSAGLIYPRKKNTVLFQCNRRYLDQKTYLSNLKINSNSEVEIPDLEVEMVVPQITSMETNPSSLLFDYFTETRDVWLKNTGNTTFTWNATEGNYLTISPKNGSLSKRDSVLIHIELDRNNMPSGTNNLNISIANNFQFTENLEVTVNHFIQHKWMLDFNIIDAEFCTATNKLIVVSTNPNQLSILNPETQQVESIALNAKAKCVSVIHDGTMAAIGHDGFITYVDLVNKSIDLEYNISCNAYDIILAENKWCYVAPDNGSWVNLHSVNYTNGQEYQTTESIYSKVKMKKQPGSPYLYLCSTTLSSSALQKADISGGPAEYLYSKFNSDTWGNFWFAEDGSRIFTISKKVYRTSVVKEDDMQYNGSIESENYLFWVDHSAKANKVFTIAKGEWSSDITASRVDVYSASYLNYLKSYPLESFLVPSGVEGGRVLSAEGRYVFANQSGTRLYAIVQAEKESGMLFDWAVQNIEVE